MARPQTVADIMVSPVKSCRINDHLGKVRLMMGENNIRHVPVLGDDDSFVGVVNQKAVLKHAIQIANKFGMDELERQEAKVSVATVVDEHVKAVNSGTSLEEAGRFFLESKHGCLPVVDNGRLVGIVTSADFVKLSLQLLQG